MGAQLTIFDSIIQDLNNGIYVLNQKIKSAQDSMINLDINDIEDRRDINYYNSNIAEYSAEIAALEKQKAEYLGINKTQGRTR